MELSYSQNLEDYHLALAFAGQSTGTYVDLGAGHPIADNVSFWFYERGWQGVVVEPQLEIAALYERLRPRDIVPVAEWHLLGPMASMNGILLFGWSTAIIFEVLRKTLSEHPSLASRKPALGNESDPSP